jgi:hypothetical protein
MYFHFETLITALRMACRPEHFSWRHLFFAVTFTILFLMLRAIVWCGRKLDYLLFPDYHKQPVKAPIFIIGNPRSGTTFIHRLISHDKVFTHFKLVHTIFPAISFYRLFEMLEKLDLRLGGAIARLINRISNKGFKGWKDVHKTGPKEVESDEMLFVYTMLSPLVGLLFPYFEAMPYVSFVDKLPSKQRKKIMDYYLDCLKRHVYSTGPDKILLEKVALIAGRLQSILETLPDMRLVHMVRHPYQSIPSLISMFAIPWKTMAPNAVQQDDAYQSLAEVIFAYYRYLLEIKKKLPAKQYLEIYYDDLVADPKQAVERIYSHFGLPMGDEHRLFLEEESQKARSYKSKHHYSLEQFGLSKQQVYEALEDVFEAYGFEP